MKSQIGKFVNPQAHEFIKHLITN